MRAFVGVRDLLFFLAQQTGSSPGFFGSVGLLLGWNLFRVKIQMDEIICMMTS